MADDFRLTANGLTLNPRRIVQSGGHHARVDKLHGGLLAATAPQLVCREAKGDIEVGLAPTEKAIVTFSVASRRAEFATTRYCAHEALAALGRPAPVIDKGPGGEPIWPSGVVGSLTHCTNYRAAAVALARDVGALGIDAQPDVSLPSGILTAIASTAEQLAIGTVPAAELGVHLDTVLFCCKEATFKAAFPLYRQWWEPKEIKVDFAFPKQSFRASLPGLAHRPCGLWATDGETIVAVACIS